MNFLQNSRHLDEELMIRYAQCSALMPMMQFSAAPWRVLNQANYSICREMARLHVQYGSTIYKLAQNYKDNGEPIIRYLEYCFPHQGLAKITDQFMLGETMMIAPVLDKNAASRKVVFPYGTWSDRSGNRIKGPCEKTISVTLEMLPYFIKEG